MTASLSYSLTLAGWLGSWYACSITMTLYNKWLFALHGLRFPLLITSMHFALKNGLARFAMRLAGERPPPDLGTCSPTARALALTGFATAADVALSNQAFLYVRCRVATEPARRGAGSAHIYNAQPA